MSAASAAVLLPVGPRGGVRAPAAEAIDRGQLVALMRLTLGQALRRGTDLASGAQGHPLRQIVVSMGFVGLLVALGVAHSPDADAFLARVFFGAFLLTATAIVPDPPEVHERHLEILFSKPVAVPTQLAARALMLGVLALLVALPFALPGIVAATWHFGLPAWRVPADVAALLAGVVTLALLWLQVLLLLAQRLGVRRVRRAVQSALMLSMLAISLLAALRVGMGVDLLPDAPLRALAPALPSTWFARFSGSANGLERAGVLLLVLAAPLLYVRRGLAQAGQALDQPEPLDERVSAPLSARLLGALAGRALPSPTAGVAIALLTLSAREDVARLKARAMLLVALGFFAWGFVADDTFVPFLALCYFVPTSTLDGLLAVRQSAHPEAAWIFRKAPLDPTLFVSAFQWAVAVRYTLPPWLLAAVVLVQREGWLLGALFALALLAAVRLLLALVLALQPSLPLAQSPRAGQGLLAQLATWLASLLTLGGYASLWALGQYAGPVAPLVVLLGLGALLAATYAARAAAAQRLRGVELEA